MPVLSDLAIDELGKLLQNPAYAIAAVVAIVNAAKDQLGVNGRLLWLAALGASMVVSALSYVGAYATTSFDFGDWIGNSLLYTVGAILVWSGIVKAITHKAKGTEPQMVAAAKEVGKSMVLAKPLTRVTDPPVSGQ